jgi:2-dehydro-3-deoxyphosphogluconate aldolase/(4S)-4-hydroxy-2-oxoglutarate aldolase
MEMRDRIVRHGIVPVAVLDDADDAVPLARALAEGGLPVLELTLRTEAALRGIENIARECPDVIVGAGTVLHPSQVPQVMRAGARFALSPGVNLEVVREAVACGLFFLPGVMTPSDVEAVLGQGCRLLKFFPAVPAGGIPMLQALAGPYVHAGVEFVPLGGVNCANMGDFLRLDSVPAVGGTWLCDRRLVRERRWTEITRLASEACREVELAFSETGSRVPGSTDGLA